MDLRTEIQRVGGLLTRSGMARHWGLSKTAVSDRCMREDFPPPVALVDGDRPVWTAEAVDAWQDAYQPAPPGPKPGQPAKRRWPRSGPE